MDADLLARPDRQRVGWRDRQHASCRRMADASRDDRYERRTGRAMRDFPFYQAFALFKLAIIMEGSYARFLLGQTDDPLFALIKQGAPALADAAWSVCNSASRPY